MIFLIPTSFELLTIRVPLSLKVNTPWLISMASFDPRYTSRLAISQKNPFTGLFDCWEMTTASVSPLETVELIKALAVENTVILLLG